MNRKGLKEAIVFETHLSEEQVERVLCALESIIPSLLLKGQELHWADLITAYTVWKRPVDHNGRPIYEDKQGSKIRYRLAQCVFSGRVIRSLREHRFNLADKQAMKKPVCLQLNGSAAAEMEKTQPKRREKD